MDPTNHTCLNGESVAYSPQGPQHAAESSAGTAARLAGNRRRRTAILIGVSSTILSVLGFGALTLFEQYNSLVSEMRSDLKHFNETSSEFVKRESFQRFRDTVKERLFKELPEANLAKYRLEEELKASEKARIETAEELRRLRERLAYLEGRQAVAATVKAPAPTPNNID